MVLVLIAVLVRNRRHVGPACLDGGTGRSRRGLGRAWVILNISVGTIVLDEPIHAVRMVRHCGIRWRCMGMLCIGAAAGVFLLKLHRGRPNVVVACAGPVRLRRCGTRGCKRGAVGSSRWCMADSGIFTAEYGAFRGMTVPVTVAQIKTNKSAIAVWEVAGIDLLGRVVELMAVANKTLCQIAPCPSIAAHMFSL